MNRIELARAISKFKKEAQDAFNSGKSLNYKTVINTLRSFGINVETNEESQYKDTKKEGQRFVTSRLEVKGMAVCFEICGKKFNGFSGDRYFSFNLTSFLSQHLNALELAKQLI